MKITPKAPTKVCFLEVQLDQLTTDYLWKIIDNAKIKKTDYKKNLAGNISQSLELNDHKNYFYKTVCIPCVNEFRKANLGKDPIPNTVIMERDTRLLLNGFWVNYQYQTEFNPQHNHKGVYSFAIWLKIPYDWREQSKMNQFDGIEEKNIKAGNFEFTFTDFLGNIQTTGFQLSPKLEGTMLFFPAALKHAVYPFYGTSEPRISIAGNLMFDTTNQPLLPN